MKIPYLPQTSLQNRLIISLGITLLPMVLLALSFFYTYPRVINPLDEAIRISREEDELVMELNIMILKTSHALQDYLAGEAGARERFLSLSNELDRDFKEAFKVGFKTSEKLSMIKSAQQEWQQARPKAQAILTVPLYPSNMTALQQQKINFDVSVHQADKTLKQLYKIIDQQISQELVTAHTARHRAAIIMFVMFGLGLAGTFVVGKITARSIILPLRALEAGANHFGEGDFSYRVMLQRKDELEQLAVSFNAMAAKVEEEIKERRRIEEEQDRLILQLQNALATIKTLGGLLPICSSCKKIRDDQGYWHQVETYIRDHSQAEFTHGLCPECLKKLYPELNHNNKR